MIKTNDIPSIATSAMLATLNISVFVGRKKDKSTEAEVQVSKGAGSSRAASVYKNLFADTPELKDIISYAQECRTWFNKVTLPWDNNGTVMLPTATFFEIDSEIRNREQAYWTKVEKFIKNVDVLISKQAFTLGSMFDRSEFPTKLELAQKFAFKFSTFPMPMAGDFRVDMDKEAIALLQERCNEEINNRINSAVADIYGRIRDRVEHIKERMVAALEYVPGEPDVSEVVDEATGEVLTVRVKSTRKPKIYESLLDQAIELCGDMQSLNITNDPRLEEIRAKLYNSLIDVDIKSLRESPEMQESVKTKMDDILSKFDF